MCFRKNFEISLKQGSVTALGRSKHWWKLIRLILTSLKKKINYIALWQKKSVYVVLLVSVTSRTFIFHSSQPFHTTYVFFYSAFHFFLPHFIFLCLIFLYLFFPLLRFISNDTHTHFLELRWLKYFFRNEEIYRSV